MAHNLHHQITGTKQELNKVRVEPTDFTHDERQYNSVHFTGKSNHHNDARCQLAWSHSTCTFLDSLHSTRVSVNMKRHASCPACSHPRHGRSPLPYGRRGRLYTPTYLIKYPYKKVPSARIRPTHLHQQPNNCPPLTLAEILSRPKYNCAVLVSHHTRCWP